MKQIHFLHREDESDSRDLFESILEDEGYRVTHASLAGKGVVQATKRLAPDLVVLPFSVEPDIDAQQVAIRLWQLCAIPVIFIVDKAADIGTLRRILHTLPCGYVKRDVGPQELAHAVQLALHWAGVEGGNKIDRLDKQLQRKAIGEVKASADRAHTGQADDEPHGGAHELGAGLMHNGQRDAYLKLLSQAMEQSPASVMITDTQGRIEYINTQFTQVSGYSMEEVRGRNPRLLKSGETPQQTYQELWESILSGHCWTGTLHNRRKDGSLYWERAVIQGITDERGKVTHLLAVKEDITDLKEAERRENEKNRLLKQQTEQLAASEFRWKYALEGAGDGVWDWDVQSGESFLSKRWKGMLGYREDEICNGFGGWDSLIHPEDRARVEQALRGYLEGDRNEYAVEHRLLCKEGDYKWILARGVTVSRDEQGRPLRMIGTHTDISRRRETEQRIRDSEAQLLAIFENSQVGIMLLMGDRFANGNQRLAEILGYDEPGELQRVSAGQLYLSAEGFRQFSKAYHDILADHQAVRVEHPLRRKDGTPVWCQLSGKALDTQLPADLGKGVIWMVDDISQRKQAGLDLLAANRALSEERELFTGGPAMVFRWLPKPGWPVEFCTENVKLELGYNTEAFIQGRLNFADLVHPQDLKRVADEVSRYIADGRADFEQEYRLRHADGEYRVFYDFTRVIRDAVGEVSVLHGYLLDITTQKESEQERTRIERELQHARKMEALGQLTGGVAHEFNNMLAVILGHAALMRARLGGDGDEKLLEYLRHIEQAGEQSKDMVRQMLTFSRSEEAAPMRTLLKPLVEEIVTLARATLPSSIKIDYQAGSGVQDVRMNAGELQQILMNLFVNARDAMRGKGKITLGLRQVDQVKSECDTCHTKLRGSWVELKVTDTGEGIAPDHMERVFEPFFTTKPVGKGTGLGLSVVQGLMERHGGHVMIRSKPGQGTVIRLMFPPLEAPEPPLAEALRLEEEGVHRRLSGDVLVVDDEPGIVLLLREILEESGLRVHGLTESRQALKLLEDPQHAYDLMIVDQTMPGLTGTELLKEARQLRPGLPVILCTGHSDQVDEASASRFGIQRYLEKPIDIQALRHAVESLIPLDSTREEHQT
ncbi:MAG: PAS domain-containing protein [Candidatus Thiodiazotropha sp. (ex Dulcina madagascariensis)]|nr:PAS domain-containing protein [Candidatus Thiodiazotropha sp. (ex Dulcina madagascariensis)]MCU7927377.1 PAS domain-containing protein [Candidatus Thiodiazotropha sp. (ex Dulcina madagascariensis)]